MKSFNIKWKILLFGLCAALIPIALITTMYYLYLRTEIRDREINRFTALAKAKKNYLLLCIASKENRVIDFCSDGYIRESLEKITHGEYRSTIIQSLTKYLKTAKLPIDTHMLGIHIVDTEYNVIVSTDEKMAGKNIYTEEKLLTNMDFTQKKVYLYPLHFCSLCGMKGFHIISPIHHLGISRKEPLGYLIACFDVSAINEIFTDYRNIGDTGEVYLVNRDKIMITESRFVKDAPLQQKVDTEPVRKILESSQEMVGIYTDYRERQVVGVSIDIPDCQWILLAETDKAELFASLKTLGIISLVLGVSVCLLVSCTGTLFAASISRPIQKLKAATKSFSAGNFKGRVSLRRNDELGELANSFNSMADTIEREIQYSSHTMSELVKSELKYRSIINNTTALISIIDMNGRYLLINKEYENFIHKKTEEVAGKTVHDILPRKAADEIVIHDKKVFETKQPVQYKIQVDSDTGQHTFISVKFPIFKADGIMYAIGSISTDITDLKKMETELLHAQKLQGLGVMASGIAHELNNILAVIDANIQLLIKESKGRIKLLQALSIIREQCIDGAEVVRRMKEFTSTSVDPRKMIQVNMNSLVNNIIVFTKPLWKNIAEGKGLKYQLNTDCLKNVPNIKGNSPELREVVLNIFLNALDAMPEGGTISLSTWEKEGYVFLSIADTGTGMTDEVKAKIFDPFFTTKKKGMGLGMSVVYGIVKRHGGTIEVQSQPGKGSTFTLKFPATAEELPPQPSSKDDAGKKRKSKYRILLVEDELAIGKILENLLSDNGYIVQYVNEGRKAIDLLSKECFDLMLCDIGLPDVSVWDIIKFIETVEKKPKIGILAGIPDIKEKYKNGQLLAFDFIITSPYELEEVLSFVRRVFDNTV